MSEFLAEARVLVLPDTTKFAGLLKAQLLAAVAAAGPVTIPVVTTAAAGAGGTALVRKEAESAALSTRNVAKEQVAGAKAADSYRQAQSRAAKEVRDTARAHEQLARGASASGLSLLGVRGATLAASAPFLAGTAAVVSFAKALGTFASFQSQLQAIQAIFGATAGQIARVATEARQLGKDLTLPATSASDAAEAIRGLAESGLSLQASMSAARSTLLLARAAGIGVADAATLMASALHTFNLNANQSAHVADILAGAAHRTQESVADVAAGLQTLGPISRQFGISLADSAALLTILARNGVRGSQAANILRTAIFRLLAPTKNASEELRKLGVQVRDTSGNFRPEVFRDLEVAISRLPKAQQAAAIATLLGARAARVQAALGQTSIAVLHNLTEEYNRQGVAADEARLRNVGLAGSARELRSNLSDVGLAIGEALAPGLNELTRGLSDALVAAQKSSTIKDILSQTVSAAGTAFSGLGTIIRTLAPAFGVIAQGIGAVVTSIGVGTLLAGAAAFKAFNIAVASFRSGVLETLAIRALLFGSAISKITTAMFAAESVAGGFRVGMAALSAGLAGLAAPLTALAVVIAIATTAFAFLAGRESALDQANKQLTDSTQALGVALTNAGNAARDAAQGTVGVRLDRALVEQNRLAAADAQRQLASSSAAKGSEERRRLENNLALALGNLANAEFTLKQAIKDEADAQGLAAVAAQKARDARKTEVQSIEEVTRQLQIRASAELIGTRAAQFDPVRRTQAEAQALQKSIALLQEHARVDQSSTDANIRGIGRREAALAQLEIVLKRTATPREIAIVLNARSLAAGLAQIAAELGIQGGKSAQEFVRNLLEGLKPVGQQVQDVLNTVFLPVLKIFTDLGGESARHFSKALKDGLRAGAQGTFGELAGLDEKLLTQQIQGVSRQAQIATLRQENVLAQQRLNRGKLSVAARRKLKAQIKSNQEQIASIEQSIASDAKTAARKVKDAQDKANQAFLESFAPGEQARLNAITSANLTKTLTDDIAANRRFIAGEQAEIAAIRERIRRLNLHGDALKAALAAIRTANQKIFDAKNTIAQEQAQQVQDRASAAQAARDARQAHLQAMLSIAQTTTRTSDDRRALEAIIRFDEEQIARLKKISHRTREQNAQLDGYRVDLAQQNQAYKAIIGEQKKTSALQQAEFAFLQTQAGFAANLIGNLIPGGLGGLVGGTTAGGIRAQISPNLPIRQQPGAGGFPPGEKGATPASQVGHAFTQALAQRDRGVTSGQGSTQIELLRRLLAAVNRLNRSADHPEAKQQRRTGAAIMDYHGESAGM